jgi:acetyltransferase-like isoleucine patch superfamily enzyme
LDTYITPERSGDAVCVATLRNSTHGHACWVGVLQIMLSSGYDLSQTTMNYSESELRETFGSVGQNVSIHRSCIIFGGSRIHIGSNVRIDCFTMLSAGDQGITIGDHVHIAVGCYLFGSGGKIRIGDFAGLSARVSLFTSTDDYLLGYLTNPTVPDKYKRVTRGDVVLNKHALVGCGAVIMPCTLGVAASVAALSFVCRNVADFDVVKGSPAVKVASRPRRILDLEKQLREETKLTRSQ